MGEVCKIMLNYYLYKKTNILNIELADKLLTYRDLDEFDFRNIRARIMSSYGIFSLDPAPGCTNDIFSVKMDNQVINFSNPDTAGHYLFIRN